jgi:hypothetical protein
MFLKTSTCSIDSKKRGKDIVCKRTADDSSLNDTVASDVSLSYTATEFRNHVATSTHKYRLKKYERTFIGHDAVDFLVDACLAKCRKDAATWGSNLFHHVTRDHLFKDDFLFYSYCDQDDSGDSSRHFGFILPSSKIDEIAKAMQESVQIKNRRYHFKVYKDCFLGIRGVLPCQVGLRC